MGAREGEVFILKDECQWKRYIYVLFGQHGEIFFSVHTVRIKKKKRTWRTEQLTEKNFIMNDSEWISYTYTKEIQRLIMVQWVMGSRAFINKLTRKTHISLFLKLRKYPSYPSRFKAHFLYFLNSILLKIIYQFILHSPKYTLKVLLFH